MRAANPKLDAWIPGEGARVVLPTQALLPDAPREGGFPVLLQVHGGAWVIGEKEQQAKPLMYHMAQRGWVCVAINYRLSPKAAFPAHIVDVKKAIAWIREHIGEYGGNPDFIVVVRVYECGVELEGGFKFFVLFYRDGFGQHVKDDRRLSRHFLGETSEHYQ